GTCDPSAATGVRPAKRDQAEQHSVGDELPSILRRRDSARDADLEPTGRNTARGLRDWRLLRADLGNVSRRRTRSADAFTKLRAGAHGSTLAQRRCDVAYRGGATLPGDRETRHDGRRGPDRDRNGRSRIVVWEQSGIGI